MEPTEIFLRGAPDDTHESPEAKSKNNVQQVMQIDLSDEELQELVKAVNHGAKPEILFGKQPTLKYRGTNKVLQSSPERMQHELYSTDNDGNFAYAGMITHTLALRDAEEAAQNMTSAEEKLKNNLNTIKEERAALKTQMDSSPLHASKHNRNLSRNALLKSSHLTPGRSQPSSPAFDASPRAAPTSAPSQNNAAKLKAMRTPIVHLLAVKPRSSEEITKMIGCKAEEAKTILDRVATLQSSAYEMKNQSYKDLNPFEFPYQTDEERQAAVDNAIRAFDRTRLPKDDKLWQKLLPKGERGKGKVLSKLVIQPPSQLQNSSSTPKLPKKPTGDKKESTTKKLVTDKKETATKKLETKKTAGEAATKQAMKKPVEKEPVKKGKAQPQEPAGARRKTKVIKSAAVVPKEDREEENTPGVLKTSTKPKVANNTNKPTSRPVKKATGVPARPPNKPKNPSPLSASSPVNASDFEVNHPVHKALSASTSPAKSTSASNSDRSLKRRANDVDSNIHNHAVAKSRKLNVESNTHSRTPVNGFKPGSHNSTPSGSASSSAKRKIPTIESDIRSSGSTPAKRPRLSTASQQTNTQSTSSDSPSDTSPTSPLEISYQQTIDLSQRFQAYYGRYHKLHTQLSTSPEPPTSAQRTELLRMHDALVDMKEKIRGGAAKHAVAV